MNIHSTIRCLSALAVTGLLSTLAASAADPAPPPPQRDRAPERGAGGFRGAMLDEKQREVLREAMQNQSEDIRKLDEKMRVAQKELVQAVMAEKYDEKVVRDKAEVVSKLQVEQTVLRAKAFKVVVPTLKPEQREQLENSPFGMGMMMGGFGGGMRMGGPPDRQGDPGQGRPRRGADQPAR